MKIGVKLTVATVALGLLVTVAALVSERLGSADFAVILTALILGGGVSALVVLGAVLVSRLRAKPVLTVMDAFQDVAAMKDSLRIGIFFMDGDYVIQDNYSRFLGEMLSDPDLKGKRFTDLLAPSMAKDDLDFMKSYLDMVFNRAHDAETLSEINPLNELHYVDPSGVKKIFHCEPVSVDIGKGRNITMVTMYDITAKIELQEKLRKEEKKRDSEMRNLFELLQVDPSQFESFREDVEQEFARVNGIMGNGKLSSNEILAKIYDSVVAIRSNSVALGLNNFAAGVQEVETQIKKLKDRDEEVLFDDMLHLTIEVERLAKEKDSFKLILERIQAFKVDDKAGGNTGKNFLLELLNKTAGKAAADTEKKVRFIADDVDREALEKGPGRVMKEVLMQLVRNAVTHGVEPPDERLSGGKDETGTVRLFIKFFGGGIHVRLVDDGRGLDFDRIREKALRLNLVRPEEADDKNRLLKAMFSLGFSTVEDGEGGRFFRGIGLNLVRDRVREVHGRIKLQTEFGRGTAFNIFFPAENARS